MSTIFNQFKNDFSREIKRCFESILKNIPQEKKNIFLSYLDLGNNNSKILYKDEKYYLNFLYPNEQNSSSIKLKNNKIIIDGHYFKNIFKLIFSLNSPKKIYHYTSLNTIFKILMNKSIWFTSLAGLNDKSEYASSELYYNKKIINEFHHERVSAANRRFILSFSELADDLNQWRLYGDNGTGVCLEFDFKSPEFLFGQQAIKIIPGNIIYTNDFFNILKNLHEKYSQKDIDIEYRDLEILKHFIKNTDYENEKEYRLIIYKEKTSVKRNWYLNRYNILNSYQQIGLNKLPITLKNIIVGPKCSERDLNIGQLKLFLQDNPIYKNNQQVKVNESEISHYR